MEKNVKISILCQVYGKLLTKKQFEIITDYYDNDLSLSEIAENNQITRQAVRDIIKKKEKKLFELEEELSFVEKNANQEKIINNILKEIIKLEQHEKKQENKKIIEKVIKELETLI